MLLPSWVVYYFILYYTVGQDPHHPSRNDGSLLGCTFSQTLKKPKGTNLWDLPPDLSALSSPQGSQAASSHLKRYRFEEWFWTYWWVATLACLSAITKTPQTIWLEEWNLFCHNSGGWKSKVRILLSSWLEEGHLLAMSSTWGLREGTLVSFLHIRAPPVLSD